MEYINIIHAIVGIRPSQKHAVPDTTAHHKLGRGPGSKVSGHLGLLPLAVHI